MIELSAPSLQRFVNETGYQPRMIEKVLRLLDLLQAIASDQTLSDRLVLKGGTALNLFHLSLDRLSVDIDLNYVGALDRATMKTERVVVEATLKNLLESRGYAIRYKSDEHAGGKWLMRYASALGGYSSLEIDLNYMARQPLFGMARMRSIPLGDVQVKDVFVLDLHEVVAGKLVALISRHAARDLFDARRILSIDGLNWDWIKAAVLAIGASDRRDWRLMSIDKIQGNVREFLQKLVICLPHNRFTVESEIDAWLEETVALVHTKFSFLFDLTSNEQAFLDGVLDRGEVDADLLDIPPDVRTRIAEMPMLAWKTQHVRKRRLMNSE